MVKINIANIREKIIISEYYEEYDIDKYDIDKYSDIELSAVYSQNGNNFHIFRLLLNEYKNNNEILDNVLLLLINYTKFEIRFETIKLLINYGADVNFIDSFGFTILMIACNLKQDISIIKMLCENGSNVNAINKNGDNVLSMICQDEDVDIEIVKLLLCFNVNVNNCNHKGNTSLMYAVSNSNYDLTKLLIIKKANICILDECSYDIIKGSLNSYKNRIGIKNKSDQNLFVNIRYHVFEFTIVKRKFLIREENINYQDDNFMTPLIICFMLPDFPLKYNIIKLLLDNKADIYIKNKQGKNILNIEEKCIDENSDVYSLIFNYINFKNDNLCEYDINFIYCNFNK